VGEIKSAAEIAREKIEKLGEVTEEERLKWKYVPEGEKLAARYLKEDCNLVTELNRYEEKARKHITGGVTDVLMRNICMPINDAAGKATQKAMEGLKAVKNDKAAVENVFSKIRNIMDHYSQQGEQQKKQAYESLKAEWEAKIQQALKQQMGANAGNMKIDVATQPQFQGEWMKLQAQMDSQYTTLLDEYKQELSAIA
jgi:hypothetical protein